MYHVHDMILVPETGQPVEIGSAEWFDWLSAVKPPSFSLHSGGLTTTLRVEHRGDASFWYAYHKHQGKLRKVYVGVTPSLTREHLTSVVEKLIGTSQADQSHHQVMRLLLLGKPGLYLADREVSLSAKTLLLLAYLALADTPPTREHLFSFLWPESAQEAARKNLQNMLWQLRSQRTGQGDIVHVQSHGRVMLSDAIWVDARAFLQSARLAEQTDQHVLQTIELYRGPFLEGLTGIDATSAELWLFNERERFNQICLRLLIQRIERLQSNQSWTEMLQVTQQALALDPLQEPLHRFAMLAHARLGQRTDALRQYEHVQSLLQTELGIAPLPETETLREAIANGNLTRLPSATRHSAEPRQPILSLLPFVGRDDDSARLDAALGQALQQQKAFVVGLAGELGIGKSRLWREWSTRLPMTITVVECQFRESTQTIPLAPVTRLLTDIYTQAHAPRLESLWLSELSRIAPELSLHYPGLPAPMSLPPDQERGRLYDACLHALLAMSKQPLVCFLDDVHWADAASLDWIEYCLAHIRHQPLLVVVAYRPQERTDALHRLLATWERAGIIDQVALEPLAHDDVAAICAARHISRAWEHALYQQSAGNPYYLGELLHAGEASLPASLTTLVQSRLAQLPAVARQIVQTAAILDPEIDLDLLRYTSGRSEEELLDALDTLLETGFLQEGERTQSALISRDEQPIFYLFPHPFVATVLRGNLGSARRMALHRRAADALVQRYGEQHAPIAGQLFRHFDEAGQHQQAAKYAEMAGNYALGASSAAQAESYFHYALRHAATTPRYMGMALAQMRTGKIDEARTTLQQALGLAIAQKEMGSAMEIAGAYFETYLLVNQFREALQWIEQPEIQHYLKALDPDTEAIIRGLLLVMKYRLITPSLSQAEKEGELLLQRLERNPNPLLAAQIYQVLATTYAEQGKWQETIDAYRHVADAAHELRDLFHELLARNNIAYHLILAGDLAEARREIETVKTHVKRFQLNAAYYYVYNTYGELWLAEGNWQEAERWWKRALAQVKQRSDTQAQTAELYANLGRAARGRGDIATATTFLERARMMIEQAEVPYQSAQITLWLADLYCSTGKEDAARALLDQTESLLRESGWQELRQRAEKITSHIRQTHR